MGWKGGGGDARAGFGRGGVGAEGPAGVEDERSCGEGGWGGEMEVEGLG